MVRDLNKRGRTIIYTTHIMSEAETLCDRVAIIDRGEVIALGTVPELKATLGNETSIHLEGVIPEAASVAVGRLQNVDKTAVTAVNGHSKLTVVTHNHTALLPELIQTLSANGAILQKISPEEVTLEDVFITQTGRTLAEDTSVKG
jgi:ABC-2 type transport system ATP-binding protein